MSSRGKSAACTACTSGRPSWPSRCSVDRNAAGPMRARSCSSRRFAGSRRRDSISSTSSSRTNTSRSSGWCRSERRPTSDDSKPRRPRPATGPRSSHAPDPGSEPSPVRVQVQSTASGNASMAGPRCFSYRRQRAIAAVFIGLFTCSAEGVITTRPVAWKDRQRSSNGSPRKSRTRATSSRTP